jgi:predicted transcriptional regulator
MDIAADMLEVAQGGAIKTKIMYKAFLSFPQLKEYLELLQGGGLLDYVAEEKEYHATERGKRFLKMYKEVGQTILPAGLKKKKTSA